MGEKYIPAKVIRERRAEIAAQIANLQIEDAMLVRLEGGAVEVANKGRGTQRPKRGGRVSTSETIRQYVATHPGSTQGDVVNAVIDKIETTSKKPRRLLYNTIATLLKRNHLRPGDDGGLYLATNGGKS